MAKILLADDSTHAQRMGTKILSAEGHEVTAVSNGQAAIKIMDEVAPDLIVADVFMPGKNGFEVCQWVKSNPKWKHVPVLLTIGAMEPYDPAEGRKAQADGLVTKPLESSDLVETVQKLLATAKKPAPPPAPVKEPVEETAPAESLPEEEITQAIAPPERLELPEEFAQQPVALFGDLLESSGHPEGGESPGEEEQLPLAQSFLADMSTAETLETVPAEEAPTDVSPWSEPQAEEKMVWAAAPAPVTEQDKKLFDPASDWGSLTKMVEEEGEAQPATPAATEPEPLPAPVELPSLASPPEAAAETTSNESATIASALFSPAEQSESPEPTVAPFDRSTIEQLVRESVEEMMPQ
ncbi:MAG: response regulator, partial [Acidobacteria bacterium]|nr:response regulator [Acidobacteriota bacterium]